MKFSYTEDSPACKGCEIGKFRLQRRDTERAPVSCLEECPAKETAHVVVPRKDGLIQKKSAKMHFGLFDLKFTRIFLSENRSQMDTKKQSFLSDFKITRAKSAADLARESAVIVKTPFIPAELNLAAMRSFLNSPNQLFVFAALERIKGDNTIVVGYQDAKMTPFYATELLKYLVKCRVHPEIYACKSPAHEIRDFIEQCAGERGIEFIIADDELPPLAPPPESDEEPEVKAVPQEEPDARSWWTSLGATSWDPQTSDVVITPKSDIEAALSLYHGSVACDEKTAYKRMKIRMKNILLELPEVDPQVLEHAVAHRSLFDM